MADYADSADDAEYAGDDDKKILEACRKGIKACVDEESTERAKMLDDLRFCTLDQWPQEIRAARENDLENGARPCLTIDKLSQYFTQIINDVRQGRPGINVRPQDDSADVETAKILKGIIRNIEDQSSADIPYTAALDNAVKIGLGYFRITTEYVSDDSFDQEIFIRSIPNTFSVYLGKHIMPDGSDAESGYVVEQIPIARFKTEYPDAKAARDDFDELQDQVTYWHTGEMVTVVEEYCFEKTLEMLYFLADGTTITKSDYEKWPASAGPKPEISDKRMAMRKQLKWRKMTGVEVLDKRDLPGKYIPIVEVIGREALVDGKRVLWGLARPAKDSLRMYNYWASTITEKMALSPKAPFIGAVGQFKTAGDRWKKANTVNFATLEYDLLEVNGNAVPPPQRQQPMAMEAAAFHFMQVIEHDVQTSLGMFKAAVGETESQQSGRAILALQKESDTGTYHFGANLGVAIRHAGRIIVDLIPHYYDTKRVVRIIGEDGEVQSAQLDPTQAMSHKKIPQADGSIKSIYNPGVGQYDVAITVGPSYNTKRMEAAATFVEMSKGSADPASAAVLRYLVMRNSDSAGSDEATKLLKTLLPPQALQALDSKEQIPPRVQAMLAQVEQKMAMMQEEGQKLQQENVQLKAKTQEGMAKVELDREVATAEYNLNKQKIADEADLAERKAQAEFKLKQLVANEEMKLAQTQCDNDRKAAESKITMERETRALAANTEREDTAEFQAVTKADAKLDAITEGLGAMVGLLQQGLAMQQQMLDALNRPKQVAIGSVRKVNGQIAGATVTVN